MYLVSSEFRTCRCLRIFRALWRLTHQASSLISCSAQPLQLSYRVLWPRERNFCHTAFIRLLFRLSYTRLKQAGHGTLRAGSQNSALSISQVLPASILSEE